MRRAIHLGSWTIFCDIAGQVSESPANPVVTVTAVAVAREGIIASGVVCVARALDTRVDSAGQAVIQSK